MKTLGLLGGMSWLSTLEYYRELNELASRRLGGNASFPCLIHSFEFSKLAGWLAEGRSDQVSAALSSAAAGLERGGAEAVLICTNTMHRFAEAVQAAVGVPVLHIVDAVGQEAAAEGWGIVGLVGTLPTMTEPFFSCRLADRFGIECLTPGPDAMAEMHRIIFQELTQNRFEPFSKAFFQNEIAKLESRGAQACILGCTEIPLLVGREEAGVPLLDTTRIHARAGFGWAVAS